MSVMAENDFETMCRDIIAAVRSIEVTETDAWNDLSALASRPYVDSIEVFEDEIQIRGLEFAGPLLWYVTLAYGPKDDEVVTSESFPGKFEGRIEDGVPTIHLMTMDTSSFYE